MRSALRPYLIAFAVAVLALGSACSQQIVVVGCDGSEGGEGMDGGTGATDSTSTDARPDTGVPGDAAPDSGVRDGTISDGGTDASTDAGPVGCSGRYCITALVPSMMKVSVRQPITFTPAIDNPDRTALTFRADRSEITARRRAPLPPLRMSDVDISLAVDAQGVVTFTVQEVPTWFATTTFIVRLHAKGPGASPDVFADASVEVRGNILFGTSGAVYAVASDGRPARSVNFTQGKLISGASFLSHARGLLLARDGTLVVFDRSSMPPKLRRFALTGENVGLGDFDFRDPQNGAPYIVSDNASTGLAQLMDGRFVLSTYEFTRTPKSSVVLWRENGTYDRTHNALNPSVEWIGAGASQVANDILILERASTGRLVKLNPDTGLEVGVIATDISGGRGVLGVAGGNTYVGATGSILRVTPIGAKTMVSMLVTGSSDYWSFLAPYSDGRIIAGRDVHSDYLNIAVIDGTMYTGWARTQNVGGPSTQPDGLVYLE